MKKVDIASAKPKDLVVATLLRPGVPLTAGQTVVVVASNGDAPKEPSNYVVPEEILGSQVGDAERLLKASGIEVKKVEITSPRAKDTMSPPIRRRAKRPKPELLSWQSPAADDAADRLNMLDLFPDQFISPHERLVTAAGLNMPRRPLDQFGPIPID